MDTDNTTLAENVSFLSNMVISQPGQIAAGIFFNETNYHSQASQTSQFSQATMSSS
jgi:hypothetical protein